MAYPETMSELTNYPKALSHAESGGGGVSLKTLNIQNGGTQSFSVSNVIVDGKNALVTVGAVSTVAVQYVEPAQDHETVLHCSDSLTSLTEAEGIEVNSGLGGTEITISDTAEDGVTIALRGEGGIS